MGAPTLLDRNGHPLVLSEQPRRVVQRPVRARFDAAQTTQDNRNHWASADALSADAAASPLVRKTLRQRARYEVANNSYARGIVSTLANDCIGTGPRLQMTTKNAGLNSQIEADFGEWATAIDLAGKLRTLRMARCQDGEGFAILGTNPGLDSPILLDLKLIECDRVTGEVFGLTPGEVDGIRFDEWGNPRSYRVLKQHPGDAYYGGFSDAVDLPASQVIHLYRADRAEQHRGIPELTPALPLFAQLRRYTLAVLGAAESAADFAAVMFSDVPPGEDAQAVEALDEVELRRNMMLTLPAGWKLGQLDPKQPSSQYAEFKREILGEIARCLHISYNVAAGNSSDYNYASGRLDHQTYYKAVRIDQAVFASNVLDRVFRVWIREWALANRQSVPADLSHQWFWDGNEHVDPLKEAAAQEKRLANRTTNLAWEYAKVGKDWEQETAQCLREELMIAKGEAEIAKYKAEAEKHKADAEAYKQQRQGAYNA